MSKPIACKKGCAFCCYVQVHPTAPEVLRIAEHLRATMSERQLRALRKRVAEYDDCVREMSMKELSRLRLPCLFLGGVFGNRCTIYPVRPLICRGWNSTDADVCADVYRGTSPRAVPHDQIRIDIMLALRDRGLRAGLADAGLSNDLLRLPTALRIALDAPDAAERWLAGEPMFDAARIKE